MIKKKPHWVAYQQPWKPHPLREPTRTNTRKESTEIYRSAVGVDLASVSLPAGATLNDLYVDIDSHGYDDAIDVVLTLSRDIEEPNVHYDIEMVHYKDAMKRHKLELKEWRKDVEEWKRWKAQVEKQEREYEIERAKELLKKHNVKL